MLDQRNGVAVHVRPTEKEKALATEAELLRKAEHDLGTRIGQLEFQLQRGDAAPNEDWEANRSKLKSELEQAYAERQVAQTKLKVTMDQLGEWRSDLAHLQHRVTLLRRELLNTPAEDFTMQVTAVGQQPARPRRVIEDELLGVLARLARLAPDAWLAEYQDTHSKILARRGTVVLQKSYVQLADGSYVDETEFQALACENAAATQGARAGCYRRGTEVKVEDAARLGLS